MFLLIPSPFTYVVAGIFGAIIGSFLNVVIHRLPREESIVFPNSRCPQCGAAIASYDNLPILSYLILRGRCRSCQAHISPRYPAVEALTGFLWIAVVWRDGLTFALPFDLIFVSAITALIFIDAEHLLLPNAITYPGIAFALVARLAIPYLSTSAHFDDVEPLIHGMLYGLPVWAASLIGAGIGGLIGGGFFWLVGWAWEKRRGVELIGLGNVKMMFMVGAYLGWRLTLLNIFLGVTSMIGIGIFLMSLRRERNSEMLLASGVFLGIGAIVAILFGSQMLGWYLGQYR